MKFIKKLKYPIVSLLIIFLLDIPTVFAGNLVVDIWQDLDFTDITDANGPTNLNAHDHGTGSWTVNNAGGKMTMSVSAEQLTPGTINSSSDSGGTRGIDYTSAVDYIEGFITYIPAATHATASFGFWFKFPTAFIGSFSSGEPDLFYVENATAAREIYLKLEDTTGVSPAKLYMFSPEDNESASFIPLVGNTWYWITVKYVKNGTSLTRVYDTSGAQVGSEISQATGNQNMTQATWVELIGDPSNTGPFLFDDLLVDWTNGTFPLGPGVADAGASSSIVIVKVRGKVKISGKVKFR